MTNRLWIPCAALAACGLLGAAPSTRAAPDKDNTADEQPTQAADTDESDGVADIVAAYKLAEWGRRMDPPSPFALVTAAEMLHRTPLFNPTDSKIDKDHFKGPESTVKQDPKTALQGDVDKLLEEAVKMAKTNKQDVATVQAMAKTVREGRGASNGPLLYTMELRGGQTDTYSIKFKKGQWVRIAVRNGGDATLHLQVLNSKGEMRADDGDVNPAISFIPYRSDGTDYTVKVTNQGQVKVVYQTVHELRAGRPRLAATRRGALGPRAPFRVAANRERKSDE